MNTLAFTAAMVQALAWPLAVLVIVLVFRKEAKSLLSAQVKRLKAGPFEMEWERQVAQAQAELNAPPEAASTKALPSPLAEEMRALVATAPEAAVLRAHAQLEGRLHALLDGQGDEAARRGAVAVARLAAEKKLITPETARAVEGVTVMRNLAAHDPRGVGAEKALEYLTLVDAVLYSLEDRPKS